VGSLEVGKIPTPLIYFLFLSRGPDINIPREILPWESFTEDWEEEEETKLVTKIPLFPLVD